MQKTPPMHLNTSPTCLEGSGTGKRGKIHKTLKNLKLAPKKHLGICNRYLKLTFWGHNLKLVHVEVANLKEYAELHTHDATTYYITTSGYIVCNTKHMAMSD